MATFEIGQNITYTTANGVSHTAPVIGRNWWGDNVSSYIVRHQFGDGTKMDLPVCGESFKAQLTI